MDVDATPLQLGGEAVRQDLHIARQHDEIGFGGPDDLPRLRLLLHLGFPGDGQVVERDAAEIDVGVGLARMIGYDRHRIHRHSPLRQR